MNRPSPRANNLRGRPHAYANRSSEALQAELAQRATDTGQNAAAKLLQIENQRRFEAAIGNWPSAYA